MKIDHSILIDEIANEIDELRTERLYVETIDDYYEMTIEIVALETMLKNEFMK